MVALRQLRACKYHAVTFLKYFNFTHLGDNTALKEAKLSHLLLIQNHSLVHNCNAPRSGETAWPATPHILHLRSSHTI